MSLARRRVLVIGLATPIAASLAPVAALADDVDKRLAALRRPAPTGTSATRCAVCGAGDHAMLDTSCPARRRIRR